MWQTGRRVSVNFSDIILFIKNASKYQSTIFIGTDSQPHRDGTLFVSAIAVTSSNKDYDCRYFYVKHPPITSYDLFNRVYCETQMSLELAQDIQREVEEANIEIHIDVSPENSRARTSQYANTLVSMVRGCGFQEVKVKPDSWCASAIADSHSK
jgi:predicted RNase H-related nuclease YkuK (DUF458 family)